MAFAKSCCVLAFAVFGAASAKADELPAADAALAPYAAPQIRVPVAPDRRINLVCMGQGAPVVILTAGQGDWSLQWSKVQPVVAQKTRVCAWDRAGAGFSDVGDTPMDVEHNTADLARALTGAQLRGPYVLVAHSAGAYETLLYADHHRRALAGMVLVEPSIPYQDAVTDALGPRVAQLNHLATAMTVAALQKCAHGLDSGAIAAGSAAALACPSYPAGYPPALQDLSRRRDSDAARLLLHAALDNEFAAASRAVANPDRDYGDVPLIVLTAGEQKADPALPPDVAALWPQLMAAMDRGHDAYAALSRQGSNRVVPDVGHQIPSDRPQAVIDAIDEVVDRARTR